MRSLSTFDDSEDNLNPVLDLSESDYHDASALADPQANVSFEPDGKRRRENFLNLANAGPHDDSDNAVWDLDGDGLPSESGPPANFASTTGSNSLADSSSHDRGAGLVQGTESKASDETHQTSSASVSKSKKRKNNSPEAADEIRASPRLHIVSQEKNEHSKQKIIDDLTVSYYF